jgi:hypothetical protein
MKRPLRIASIALAAAFLAGCASVGIDEALKQTNVSASEFTGGKLELSSKPGTASGPRGAFRPAAREAHVAG